MNKPEGKVAKKKLPNTRGKKNRSEADLKRNPFFSGCDYKSSQYTGIDE